MTSLNPMEELRRLEEVFKQGLSSLGARLDSSVPAAQPADAPPSPALTDVAQVRQDFEQFRALMWSALGLVRRQLTSLSEQVDVLETKSRKKVLLFHGVKEEVSDVKESILDILKKLELPGVSAEAVRACHRLGRVPASEGRSRPVLVRFVQLETRAHVWSKKTMLKGTGVSVSEFLTPVRQKLFAESRRIFGVSKCWTQDASIYVLLPDGTRHKVGGEEQLRALSVRLQTDAAHEAKSTSSAGTSSARPPINDLSIGSRDRRNRVPAKGLKPKAK